MKFSGYYGRGNRVQKLMQQNTRPSPGVGTTVSAKQSAFSSVANSALQSGVKQHPVADIKVQEFKQQPVLETK